MAQGKDFRNADLIRANLIGAELSGADLFIAKLNGADLNGADLSGADLSGADLTCANLIEANLTGANLTRANLSGACLYGANLTRADLSGADLNGADLSGVTGLLQPKDWLQANLEITDLGITVYKTFGEVYSNVWGEISEGMYITETCNPLPTLSCASGVNVATASWILANTRLDVWECLIVPADYPSIVVPYATDGKFRTGGLWVLHRVDREELFRKDREDVARRLS